MLYQIGNGVFGGLLPLIGLILCAATYNFLVGLCYPVCISVFCLVFGVFMLKETHGTLIWKEIEASNAPMLDVERSPLMT